MQATAGPDCELIKKDDSGIRPAFRAAETYAGGLGNKGLIQVCRSQLALRNSERAKQPGRVLKWGLRQSRWPHDVVLAPNLVAGCLPRAGDR